MGERTEETSNVNAQVMEILDVGEHYNNNVMNAIIRTNL